MATTGAPPRRLGHASTGMARSSCPASRDANAAPEQERGERCARRAELRASPATTGAAPASQRWVAAAGLASAGASPEPRERPSRRDCQSRGFRCEAWRRYSSRLLGRAREVSRKIHENRAPVANCESRTGCVVAGTPSIYLRGLLPPAQDTRGAELAPYGAGGPSVRPPRRMWKRPASGAQARPPLTTAARAAPRRSAAPRTAAQSRWECLGRCRRRPAVRRPRTMTRAP